MVNRSRSIAILAVLAMIPLSGFGQNPETRMAFTVFLNPAEHLYRVEFRCEGLTDELLDFKIPVWMPGYYGLQDYAGNVLNFRAVDGDGKSLAWEKTTDNCWRVVSGRTAAMTVAYDVLATSPFVAHNYLDEDRGYIAPVGLFMYVAGRIRHPVTVTIHQNPKWSGIATGLDRVSDDQPATFTAPDFDTLYDCPIVLGNLDQLPPFEIRGVPHYFVGYQLGISDPEQFMKDLKPVIEAGVDVIGEVPYTHYTFLGIGPGMGGIEHLNSVAMGFSGGGGNTREKKIRMLNFLAHEYFHNFNVKRIRPIALGPFDYDKPNLTDMLWVSEGFTSYYEFLMLRRAGATTNEEMLKEIGNTIASYENKTGRLFQSATQSSFDSWIQGPFGGRGTGIVKTISYYDKGAVLGALLDFAVRHESKNRESLDSVMRTLYRKFYKELGRGWTDEEFQAVCEAAAGAPLTEVFGYASTTKDVDYAKYFAYAGLEFEKPKELPDAFLGALVEDKDGRLVVAATEPDSPARTAGLAAADEIKSLNGVSMTAAAFTDALKVLKPGGRIKLAVERGGVVREVEIVLEHRLERTWKIRPMTNPDPLQQAIWKDWVKD
ncbi:MAG: PDZ domain-containing protein [Candidatus Aminicenantes bacterium]|nr:PDZ domain-containing protein [Candidatus Aminicenantes bacterium]